MDDTQEEVHFAAESICKPAVLWVECSLAHNYKTQINAGHVFLSTVADRLDMHPCRVHRCYQLFLGPKLLRLWLWLCLLWLCLLWLWLLLLLWLGLLLLCLRLWLWLLLLPATTTLANLAQPIGRVPH